MIKQVIKNILNQYIAKKNRIIINHKTDIHINNFFEGKNLIGRDSVISNSNIGFASYIGSGCAFDKVKIGRYCAIGSNVKVISATHPTRKWVSIHPAFYSTRKQAGFSYVCKNKFTEFKMVDEKYASTIGNDVWLGDNVVILGGTKISDGAIVGSGAIVTKDVPPYAIVGGSPAKIIRYRYDEDKIGKLLDFQWWNNDEQWIIEHKDLFEDIDTFFDKV